MAVEIEGALALQCNDDMTLHAIILLQSNLIAFFEIILQLYITNSCDYYTMKSDDTGTS